MTHKVVDEAGLSMKTLLGLTVIPHPLARDVRVEFTATRVATRDKKRKKWRVMRVEINQPGCYQVGNTIYMHPELIAKLPSAAGPLHQKTPTTTAPQPRAAV